MARTPVSVRRPQHVGTRQAKFEATDVLRRQSSMMASVYVPVSMARIRSAKTSGEWGGCGTMRTFLFAGIDMRSTFSIFSHSANAYTCFKGKYVE
eukprot:6198886-Pleurochrysis_carterae.AAC.6